MSGITLIAGSLKYRRLFKKNSGRDDRTIFLSENDDKSGITSESLSGSEKTDTDNMEIVWNKRSPLSARNSILTVINEFKKIDNAILTYQPGEFNKTFHETSSPVYDLQIDRWIKGYGYLIKELIQLYIKQQEGKISLILDTEGLKLMTPVESAIFNYLKNLVRNLSVLYQNEKLGIFCFETDSSRTDDFYNYYKKIIEDTKYNPGKLYKFSDKKTLFDFGRK